jgi:hypothetical protein
MKEIGIHKRKNILRIKFGIFWATFGSSDFHDSKGIQINVVQSVVQKHGVERIHVFSQV